MDCTDHFHKIQGDQAFTLYIPNIDFLLLNHVPIKLNTKRKKNTMSDHQNGTSG